MIITKPVIDLEDAEDILQNVRTLLSLKSGSVCLNREMGVDPDIISMPMDEAETAFVVCVAQQLEQFEPRVELHPEKQIEFIEDIGNGKITPIIHLQLRPDYDGDLTAIEGVSEVYEFWTSGNYSEDAGSYEGGYTVIPKTVKQTLQTAGQTLKANVQVLAIPTAEQTNETGTGLVIGSEG